MLVIIWFYRMIDVIFSILYINKHSSVMCFSCFWMNIYNYITYFRFINLFKFPMRWVCYEVFTIWTCVIFIIKRTYSIDARSKIFTRKSHIDTTRQWSVTCKQKICIWFSGLFWPLQIIFIVQFRTTAQAKFYHK